MGENNGEIRFYRKIASSKERRITAHLIRRGCPYHYLRRAIENKNMTIIMYNEQIKAMKKELKR